MRSQARRTVQLGVLVAAAFDRAARHSTDPREVSRLAAKYVANILRAARRLGSVRGAAASGRWSPA